MGDFVVCYGVEFEFRCGVQKMVMKSCPDLMLLMLKSLEAFCFLNSHRFLGASEILRRLEVLVIGKFCFRGLTQTESTVIGFFLSRILWFSCFMDNRKTRTALQWQERPVHFSCQLSHLWMSPRCAWFGLLEIFQENCTWLHFLRFLPSLRLFVPSFICLFIHPSMCLFIHWFVTWFISLFV